MSTLTDEEFFNAPAPKTTKPPPPAATPSAAGRSDKDFFASPVNAKNIARAVVTGATFNLEDEGEAAVRALTEGEALGSARYNEILDEIRQDYGTFARAAPVLSSGLEVAGGVGSMFVPGVGILGNVGPVR